MSAASQDTADLTFPPIDVSPYRVEETTRRERWWFADGLWLNQGQEEAVVGFAWTQSLGDRGIEVRDGVLGDEYARELQVAAQRAGGGPVGPGQGARMEAGAAVLIERGLLDTCYACPDVDTVVSVVLERGPVLTGLTFSSEVFGRPEEIDGWVVCRVGKGLQEMGRFCVFVDGAAVDLAIGGVTGFVRFKLYWGTSWGDSGHALLSIDDLRRLFEADPRALLPIPVAGALRAGLRPDVAAEGQPYRPRQIRYEQTGIDSDEWTRRDTLGAAAYAEAIARGIQHPETKPPLTIGIKGAWGAGKTSLMRMVRDRLEWPKRDGSSDTLRQIHLNRASAKRLAAFPASVDGAQDLREVTAGVVLKN